MRKIQPGGGRLRSVFQAAPAAEDQLSEAVDGPNQVFSARCGFIYGIT